MKISHHLAAITVFRFTPGFPCTGLGKYLVCGGRDWAPRFSEWKRKLVFINKKFKTISWSPFPTARDETRDAWPRIFRSAFPLSTSQIWTLFRLSPKARFPWSIHSNEETYSSEFSSKWASSLKDYQISNVALLVVFFSKPHAVGRYSWVQLSLRYNMSHLCKLCHVKRSAKIFENSFLKNDLLVFLFKTLIVSILQYF